MAFKTGAYLFFDSLTTSKKYLEECLQNRIDNGPFINYLATTLLA
jgi:hypothetical protein